MPARGIVHPRTFENIDWDDIFKDGRLDFNYPPWMIVFAMRKARGDIRHSTMDLTATGSFNCTRKIALERTIDYYVHPAKQAVMDRGSALHEVAGKYYPERYFITEESPQKALLTVHGRLFGVDCSALLDVVGVNPSEQALKVNGVGYPTAIIDNKFPKDWSVSFRDRQRGRAKLEHNIQLNIGRLLLAQQPWAQEVGFDESSPCDLFIADHACGKSSGPEMLRGEHMTENQMQDATPFGGTVTLGEIIETWQALLEEISLAGYEPKDWQEIPLETRMDWISRLPLDGELLAPWFCDYCSVKTHCAKLVREYGKPTPLGGK